MPSINSPLSKLFVFLVSGYHSDVLRKADLITSVRTDTMRLGTVEDQKVSCLHFHLSRGETSGVRFKSVSVFRLGEFPSIIAFKEFWNTLESSHILIGLICQGQYTLHILGFGFWIIIPVDETLMLVTRSRREV